MAMTNTQKLAAEIAAEIDNYVFPGDEITVKQIIAAKIEPLVAASVEQRINDAVNLLCKVAEERLPKEWMLSLKVNANGDVAESFLELINPSGEEIEAFADTCPWLDAIWTAHEHNKESEATHD